MDDWFAIRAAVEYVAANPEEPAVIEFRAALGRLRSALDGLTAEASDG